MKKQAYVIRATIAGVIFGLIIAAFSCKIYPIKFLNIQFTALYQRLIFDFSIAAIILFISMILITLLFGRLYCSTICPFGILQEITSMIFRVKNEQQNNHLYKYFIAAITFGVLTGGSTLLIRYTDPYTIFGSTVTLSVFGIIFTLLILALVFFKNRFFCTNICPVGTILGLISKISLNKIYMKDECISCGICSRNCPAGCIDYQENIVDNERCVKCLKCLSVCPKQAMEYGISPKKDIKFSLKRRNLIISFSLIALFGGAVKAGIELSKNITEKLKEIILPPGAVNENRLLNKCLNCNLCVANCPNGIIQKADKDFGVIHIDYSKGKNYCKYNCNKCSEVCPSGAIKKITLEEKKKTRIAMAMVKPEKCEKCGICSYDCPVGAIKYEDGQIATVDSSKCIGCGQCKASCPHGAINIFSIKEQKTI